MAILPGYKEEAEVRFWQQEKLMNVSCLLLQDLAKVLAGAEPSHRLGASGGEVESAKV